MTAMPTRIESDLYDAAKSIGGVMSRSAAQQINHWARLGREVESAQGISHREIVDVLAGSSSYDALTAREQALVRVEWDERIRGVRGTLNFEDEFLTAGESWVEADTDGNAVVRAASPAEGPSTGPKPGAGAGFTTKRSARSTTPRAATPRRRGR